MRPPLGADSELRLLLRLSRQASSHVKLDCFFGSEVDLPKVLRSIEKEELLGFFKQRIAAGGPKRRRLAVFVHSKEESEKHGSDILVENNVNVSTVRCEVHLGELFQDTNEIASIAAFTSTRSLYSQPPPFSSFLPTGAVM